MAAINPSALQMLLSRCRSLKKLSLEHVKLSAEVCDEIAANSNMEALNLAMCEGIEVTSIRKMMSNLQWYTISCVNLSVR